MPDLYLGADGQWQLLRPMLLTAALEWIDPHGLHGWAPPNSIMSSIEPICSALNLCRFLLLREQAHSSNVTEVVRHGVSHPNPVQVLCMLHEYWIRFIFQTQRLKCFRYQSRNCSKKSFVYTADTLIIKPYWPK